MNLDKKNNSKNNSQNNNNISINVMCVLEQMSKTYLD